ncbi:hypothetical protein F8M41_018774 [Gigaspora margarita]|uniref:Uncharacterized protein n=1 Tax=Gigaspora margarita TaxID=4874 RepID=A0A8H4AL32_GIGMA|nr:hypothetical protein F8M41_018774 [Gigaspora margarita]
MTSNDYIGINDISIKSEDIIIENIGVEGKNIIIEDIAVKGEEVNFEVENTDMEVDNFANNSINNGKYRI